MQRNYQQIFWTETMNSVSIDCSIDIALDIPKNCTEIYLIIPGVDGTIDGYENKYIRMAELLRRVDGAGVVRISNPFISSFHWESNIRHALEYIESNLVEYRDKEIIMKVKIMAHSAGATMAAILAHEYYYISDLLLVNMATSFRKDEIDTGLAVFEGHMTIVYGSDDPSVDYEKELSSRGYRTVVLPNVNHYFSGKHIDSFVELPYKYLAK